MGVPNMTSWRSQQLRIRDWRRSSCHGYQVNGTGEAAPVFAPWRRMGGVHVQIQVLLTLELVGDDLSALRSSQFNPGKEPKVKNA
jgi:hypothetical protein